MSVQIWTHDVGNFIISLFEILVFCLAMYSMDLTYGVPDFILDFGFECKIGHDSMWYVETSAQAGTLWELHIIIVFMYTTLAIIVLSTIPYKYDRLAKTEKELEKEEKARKKKEKKKSDKKNNRRSKRMSVAKADFKLSMDEAS